MRYIISIVVFVGMMFSFIGCGSGGGDKKINITGQVVTTSPVHGTNVKAYSIDGTDLQAQTMTDASGRFSLELATSERLFILKAQSDDTLKSDLFAVCDSAECTISPLSTIVFDYFSSLIDENPMDRYQKTEAMMTNILGISKRELQDPLSSGSFDNRAYYEKAHILGYDAINAEILTDVSDDYVDKYTAVFPSSRQRVSRVINVQVESLNNSEGEPIALNISGVDGSDVTRGYLVDTMATRKVKSYNDDFQEIEEDEVVYLSFNVGQWKNILNSETTVLAKLFMSDMELLLLPNTAKIELVEKLKSSYKQSYTKTIDLYKFIVENGRFFEPLFQEQLDLLTGYAQTILLKMNDRKELRSQKITDLQKNRIFRNVYQNELQQKQQRDYSINGNLSIDYNAASSKFTIKNNLPVYYSLRELKNSYEIGELLTTPLIEPSELGAAGIALANTDLKWLTKFIEYTLNKDALKSTELEGDQFDVNIFPYAGSKPRDGRREYEFYKDFGFNMPTVLNVSLGIKAIVDLTAGAPVSKSFKTAMDKWVTTANNFKKYFQGVEDGLELADSLTEMLYLLLDSSIKLDDIANINIDGEEIFSYRNKLKTLNQTVKNGKVVVSSIKNIIPPTPQNVIVKDRLGFYFSKIDGQSGLVSVAESATLQTLNLYKDKTINMKQTIQVIFLGKILGNMIGSFKQNKINNVDIYSQGNAYSAMIDSFEKKYKTSIENFSILYQYNYIELETYRTLNIFTRISDLTFGSGSEFTNVEQAYESASKDYQLLITFLISNNQSFGKDLIENVVNILLKPVDMAKMITKVQRFSLNDAMKFSTDFIIDAVSKSGDKLLKSFLSSAVKQVAYMFTGTKAIQTLGAANEIVGIGIAITATPSVVPFAVNVSGGDVSFDYPSLKVLAAYNSIIPIKSTRSLSENFVFQPNDTKDYSVFVVTSQDEASPSLYDLSYKLMFSNSYESLKEIYRQWDEDKVLETTISLRKFPNDDLSREPITFGSNANEVFITISSDEMADALKPKEGGSVVDIIDILKKQNTAGWRRWFSTDDSSTIVQNKTRGIFRESFSYTIYEPRLSKLLDKQTKIDYFDRYVFKVQNAKEMRKDLFLFSFDQKYNAIKNLTGHRITVVSDGFEYEVNNGETLKILKNERVRIVDAIVGAYGENIGLKSTQATLSYLLKQKATNYEVSASNALSAPAYQFIILADKNDFNDIAPTLNFDPINSTDYDGDGLSDYDEMTRYYTNPYSADSDGDGLNDWDEINRYETQPYNADSDGDTINDWQEISVYKTDPNSVDSDGDGVWDLFDIISSIEEKPELEKNTISGVVTDSYGAPLSGITVKFEYIQDKKSTSVEDITDENGRYKIELSKEDFDNFKDDTKLVIYAYGYGYVPGIEEITKTDAENIYKDFILEPIKENEIVLEIEPQLHHLGDGKYQGTVNSDFQRVNAEGTEFEKIFYIDAGQYNNYQRAEITFEAKGVQNYSNKLYINDKGYNLANSPDNGSYATQVIPIEKTAYYLGENKLRIVSGYSTDYDDFEFINIKITFLDPVENDNSSEQEEVLHIMEVDPMDLYRDEYNEVVFDVGNNLMWQDDYSVAVKTFTFENALDYCKNLVFAGYDDWRMPKLSELGGIRAPDREYPASFDIFQNTAYEPYWADYFAYPYRWYINMGTGVGLATFSADDKFYVRCVRDDR